MTEVPEETLDLPSAGGGAMERREGRRIKRRLTCEFFHGASVHRGIILDLSAAGIFIRTNAVLAPGTEIDIYLAVSVAAPAMTLRGSVVRRRSVPATLTTLIQPGIGVKITEAPREYGLLTQDCELDDAIQIDYDATAQDADQHAKQNPPATAANASTGKSERPSQPPASAKAAEKSDVLEKSDASADTRKGHSESTRAPLKRKPKQEAARSTHSEKPKAPREFIAVLVGGSALDEIAEVLTGMGVKVVRCGPYDPQLAALDDAQLLVVSAEIAMSDPLPVDTDMLVGIAVCGEISETMRSQIRQQGFRYLLRPHLHPEALRLLLRYAVYAERDRRGRVRHPVGCEVSWRVGWKRSRGRLLDISRGGCCLLVENSPDVDARISIKIPPETVGGPALKLRGRVLRRTANAAHSGRQRTALGIVLDDLTAPARKLLAELCERWSESPPMLPRDDWAEVRDSYTEPSDSHIDDRNAAAPRSEGKPEAAAEAKPEAAASQPETPASRPEAAASRRPETSTEDRVDARIDGPSARSTSREAGRAARRAVFEREVVEVDEQARVVQALLGRDLSVEGIRVVRQLGLNPGNKLRLALFDTSQREPLMLNAEVSRDDGGSGLFLRFVDLSAGAIARIEAIVALLPAVESIDPHGDAGVIPAGVVSNHA